MHYLLLALLLLAPGITEAATLSVTIDNSSLRVGDTTLVSVTLGTDGEIMNAFEGSLVLPAFLTVHEVRYTGSVVALWPEAPHETENGVLKFAGLLPGGYQNGRAEDSIRGNLFTVVVEAIKEGDGSLAIDAGTRTYLNDGNGTVRTPERVSTVVSVSGKGGIAQRLVVDTVPPEVPTVEVVPGALFDRSDRVLTFISQDKDSGILRYEVARSFFPLPEPLLIFHETENPESLNMLDSLRILSIRAIDTYGNKSVATIAPGGVFGALPSVLSVILLGYFFFAYRTRIRAIIKTR